MGVGTASARLARRASPRTESVVFIISASERGVSRRDCESRLAVPPPDWGDPPPMYPRPGDRQSPPPTRHARRARGAEPPAPPTVGGVITAAASAIPARRQPRDRPPGGLLLRRQKEMMMPRRTRAFLVCQKIRRRPLQLHYYCRRLANTPLSFSPCYLYCGAGRPRQLHRLPSINEIK